MVPKVLQEEAPSYHGAAGEGDVRGRSQRLINHNCFYSVNDVFRAGRSGRLGKRLKLLG